MPAKSSNTAQCCHVCGAPAALMREEDTEAVLARCSGPKCDPEWQPLEVWNSYRLAVVPQTEQRSPYILFKQSAARLALIAKEGNPVWGELRAEVEDQAPAAMELVVTSVDEVEKMQEARERRLKLREIRLLAEKEHKALKRDIIDRGNAIDAAKREIVDVVEPIEQHLLEQEQFVARQEAESRMRLQQEREDMLRPYLSPEDLLQVSNGLATMPEPAFLHMRDGYEAAHVGKLAREKREREEAEAAAQKDREEREAQRVENERLRKEAAEKEWALAAERAASAKAVREREDQLAAELAEEARKFETRVAAANKAAAATVAAERERQRKELAAAEAAREKVAAAARKEQARLQAIADAAALEAKTIREAQEAADAEARRQQEAEAAARDAAAKAPDREKLVAVALMFDQIALPPMATPAGMDARGALVKKLDELAAWVRSQAEAL